MSTIKLYVDAEDQEEIRGVLGIPQDADCYKISLDHNPWNNTWEVKFSTYLSVGASQVRRAVDLIQGEGRKSDAVSSDTMRDILNSAIGGSGA